MLPKNRHINQSDQTEDPSIIPQTRTLDLLQRAKNTHREKENFFRNLYWYTGWIHERVKIESYPPPCTKLHSQMIKFCEYARRKLGKKLELTGTEKDSMNRIAAIQTLLTTIAK